MLRSGTERTEAAPREVTRTELILRSAWIFVQLAAAYLLAEQVSPFFYQQF